MSLHRPPCHTDMPRPGGATAVDQFAEVRERVHRDRDRNARHRPAREPRPTRPCIAQQLHGIVDAALAQEETPLSRADREMLARQITDEVVGLRPASRGS